MPEASPEELSFPEPQAVSGNRAAVTTAVAKVLRDMRTAGLLRAVGQGDDAGHGFRGRHCILRRKNVNGFG
ncbi:hypothetical protein Shyhy01_20770 [Streptomyces hygroscopicus subsp. hygroscopicus]|nr:hypothetical protein Shyhy01_20770 [Streptomyces hygroscopicus subsp. hygroscopicus]